MQYYFFRGIKNKELELSMVIADLGLVLFEFGKQLLRHWNKYQTSGTGSSDASNKGRANDMIFQCGLTSPASDMPSPRTAPTVLSEPR